MPLKAFSTPHTPHSTLVSDALRNAVMHLQQAKIETASLDVRLLLEQVLGCSREELCLRMEENLTPGQTVAFEALVARRHKREPMAQILGKREFWGMEFKVTADTLIPRPDSETLIEAVLSHRPDRQKPYRMLDLGTGTGCLIMALLRAYPNAGGVAVDRSKSALAVAKENAINHALQARLRCSESDWFSDVDGSFDIIIANPPYIACGDMAMLAPDVAQYEPHSALVGGEDGLDEYRHILARLKEFLAAGGLAVFEVGIGQAEPVAALAKAQACELVDIRRDLGGIARAVVITH